MATQTAGSTSNVGQGTAPGSSTGASAVSPPVSNQSSYRDYGLSPIDMVKMVDTDPRSKTSFFSETVLKTQFPMYNLFIEFPTNPNEEISKVMFPAYLSEAVTDTYNPQYNDAGPVFGRMDPIPVYSRTVRTIKVGFHIPTNSIDDAREVRKKLDLVVKNTYPIYQLEQGGKRKLIKKPPLIRLKFGNIICNPINEYNGLLGYLNSGITISHDLSNGVFTEWPGQEIYAKKYNLSLSMNVLHEFTPGTTLKPISAVGEEYSMIFPGTITSVSTNAQKTTKNQSDRIKEAEEKIFSPGFGSFGLGG